MVDEKHNDEETTFKLNEEQEAAAYYNGEFPLIIEAGAGSGKTRVMTERVKYLIDNGVEAESILICTFTNKAAEELKDRLIEYTFLEDTKIERSHINEMQISTIHSLCLDIVKERGYDFEFYDDDYSERRSLFISNHLNELGFTGEAHATASHLKDIGDKFGEYISFDVKEDELLKYIRENCPVKDNYKQLIANSYVDGKFKFPNTIVKDDRKVINANKKRKTQFPVENYEESWHNARFLQTIKALPIYKKLLKEYGATDFASIQLFALKLLQKNPKTRFKHILVDEFQDTDPIQFKIFEILMDEALKNNSSNNIEGTFTVVGDMNQNIYGFRGASENYFEEIKRKGPYELLPIKTNHRSSNQIIDLSDDFIVNNDGYLTSKMSYFRNINRDCYYIKNKNFDDEANSLADLVTYLVNNDKADYEDILILYRSVNKYGTNLIQEFTERGIPHTVKGGSKLPDTDEIKSILTLLRFIIEGEVEVPYYSSYSIWSYCINPFTGEYFEPIWDLSSETKEIFSKISKQHELEVYERGKIVQKEMNAPSKKQSFGGMFDHSSEILKEIFKEIKIPVITKEFLTENGIKNEKDLEFFNKLIELKEKVSKNPYDCGQTILSIYYELLEICGYLTVDLVKDKSKTKIINNIALITNTISNYQNMASKTDLNGLYWFLNLNIRNYNTPYHEDEGVQIMTVHEAKGLEYPITIVAGLQKDKFPKSFVDESKKHFNSKPFYCPNDCFKYKTPDKEKVIKHDKEEINVLYVAMTRAKDTLIFSTVEKNTRKIYCEMPEVIEDLINRNPYSLKELDVFNFKVIEPITKKQQKSKEDDDKDNTNQEKLNLSYSSIDRYKGCPFSYHLKYDFGFALDSNDAINYGNIVHNSLEILNNLTKEGKTLTDEEITLIVAEIHDNYVTDIDAIEKQRVIKNVLHYWNNFGKNLKILDSEYEFEIYDKDYTLKGAIDLIYETEDGNLGIIDYKNALEISQHKLSKYASQIYTYIYALKEDPKYKDKEVTKAFIYATQKNESYPINLNTFKDSIQENYISDVSNSIKSEEFELKAGDYCDWCDFKFICLTKEDSGCEKFIHK